VTLTPLPLSAPAPAPKPEPGTLVFAHIAGLVGVAIWAAQWLGAPWRAKRFAYWTHVAVYVGGGRVLEGMPHGARFSSYDYQPTAWSTLPLTAGQRVDVVALAAGYEHTPYSYLDYVALVAVKLGWPHGGRIAAYVEASGHMICSALCDDILTRAGFHPFADHRLHQSVAPAELAALGIRTF
jgi:hypothetical protein